MQPAQLIEFISRHWDLVLIFIGILAFLIYDLIRGEKGSLDPLNAVTVINRQDAIIIDVRPTADFIKGHIINAMNIPLAALQKQIHMLEKYKEHPIILNCDSGARSAQACRQLKQYGFTQVYNLRGGILAWENSNLPITRKSR